MRNPENPKYYRQLIELTNSQDNEATLREFFQQMKSLYPRSETPRFLELQYFHNQRLRTVFLWNRKAWRALVLAFS